MDDIETPKESVCIGEGKCKKCGWIGGGAARGALRGGVCFLIPFAVISVGWAIARSFVIFSRVRR